MFQMVYNKHLIEIFSATLFLFIYFSLKFKQNGNRGVFYC